MNIIISTNPESVPSIPTWNGFEPVIPDKGV